MFLVLGLCPGGTSAGRAGPGGRRGRAPGGGRLAHRQRRGAGADYLALYPEHWQAVTDATGQPFKREGALPDGFVYDTEPACRAIVTARSLAPDCAWKLLGLIQRAFYVEGRDVTLAPVLVELAEQAGIPRIEFAGEFDRADQHAATAADFTWVQDLGIAGFPTLLAERNGQLALLTNGYQPLSELSPLLGRWLERAACV